MSPARVPLIERFWTKVDQSGGENACWPWTAGFRGDGYGQIGLPGGVGVVSAHRVAFELTNGSIPKGEGYHGTVVMHRCDNPVCCNPAHLFLGTQKDNIGDAITKGRFRNVKIERQRAQTHCKRGHEFTPENTYFSQGCRSCKTCNLTRARRLRTEANANKITATSSSSVRLPDRAGAING